MRVTFRRSVILLGMAFLPLLQIQAQDFAASAVNDPGFGDVDNTAVMRLLAASKNLYAGTWNARTGCQVWRSRDGEKWECVGRDGLGNPANLAVMSMEWFRDALYAGVWNRESGAAVYRLGKGNAWEPITADGFGDPANEIASQMRSFKDTLYVACFNAEKGPVVWASPSGDPGSWREVNTPAWDTPSNSDVMAMHRSKDYLYIGTEAIRPPSKGAQLLRTDGAQVGSFVRWETLVDAGFGEVANQHIGGLSVFNEHLYAATWNGSTGMQIWRAPDANPAPGVAWEQVARDGVTDPGLVMATSLEVCYDQLFAGVRGRFDVTGEYLKGTAVTSNAVGGAVFHSADGVQWTRVEAPGFLTPPLLGAQTLAVYKKQLFVGTFGLDTPAGVWRITQEKQEKAPKAEKKPRVDKTPDSAQEGGKVLFPGGRMTPKR